MCYNKMYDYEFPSVGCIAESKSGHDAGRLYIVAAVINGDFVLLVDGNYRPVSKPKTKRIKHLKPRGLSGDAQAAIQGGKFTDALARKVIKAFEVTRSDIK